MITTNAIAARTSGGPENGVVPAVVGSISFDIARPTSPQQTETGAEAHLVASFAALVVAVPAADGQRDAQQR